MKIFLALLSATAVVTVVSSFTVRSAVSTKQSPVAVAVTQLWAAVEPTALNGIGSSHANTKKKKVLVLGGDGFCGWPTSLHLSDQGHDVVIVDNLARRNIDIELGCDSLTPIQSPEVRALLFTKTTGKAGCGCDGQCNCNHMLMLGRSQPC